jgi:hypothetical protein
MYLLVAAQCGTGQGMGFGTDLFGLGPGWVPRGGCFVRTCSCLEDDVLMMCGLVGVELFRCRVVVS